MPRGSSVKTGSSPTMLLSASITSRTSCSCATRPQARSYALSTTRPSTTRRHARSRQRQTSRQSSCGPEDTPSQPTSTSSCRFGSCSSPSGSSISWSSSVSPRMLQTDSSVTFRLSSSSTSASSPTSGYSSLMETGRRGSSRPSRGSSSSPVAVGSRRVDCVTARLDPTTSSSTTSTTTSCAATRSGFTTSLTG